jgi:hypothetical protein
MTDARSQTMAFGGRWHGRYGTAPFPVCQPEGRKGQNALTLTDGLDERLLANCKKSACAFVDIIRAAGIAPGEYEPLDSAMLAQREAERKAEAAKRSRQARAVWAESSSIAGTLAETYLRSRAIDCVFPSTLSCHSHCFHGPTATQHPALIALVEGSKGFAVHRTYLRSDGTGKAAAAPAKAMLGSTQGGAVRLCERPGSLVVA